MLKPRDCVATVPPYVPGKPPPSAPGFTTYKLSSNENPYPPLPGVIEAAQAQLESMNRYPDMGAVALYTKLSEHLDVAPETLALGTGSVALLYHLIQAYCDPGSEVLYSWRSFEAYPIATAVSGAVAIEVPNLPDGGHDLAAMAAAASGRTKVILLCSPNNPTGAALTHSAVRSFLRTLTVDALVVLDEAYREFVNAQDPLRALDLAREFDNVVVVRTFAKAYGLAGLRVGYLVAHPEIASAVRACALPFGVSSIAQAAAVASLDAEAELLDRVERVVAERERVAGQLRAQGWDFPPPQGNFVWLPLAEASLAFAQACGEAGIMVRPFAGDGVRITIGEPEGNDVLLRVAQEWRTASP